METATEGRSFTRLLAAAGACILWSLLSPLPVVAQPHEEETKHGTEHAEEHEHLKNAFGVFVGVTHEGRRDNDPSLGLEYVRRINESFSIGGTVEYTFSDHDFLVAVIPFGYYHGNWKFIAAPGVEDSDHGTEALLRLGVGYLFELEAHWEVNPQANVDLVDGEDVWVFGVSFGKSF
jgi:hypothetical protein